MDRFKKIAISILFILIATFMLENMIFFVFESSFIFKPKKYPIGNWQPTNPRPINVWITAKDGTKLHAWYLPQTHPKAIILYFHGNVGNITEHYMELVKLHDKLSSSVMILDYRGFGKSKGHPDEKGIMQDAEATRNWLAHKEHVRPQDIILLGRSLGSGVAIDLAVMQGAKGLILISPFLSLPEVVRYHDPFLFSQMMHNQFDSIHKIKTYHGPLLVIHSDTDEVIPLQQGEALFSAANHPKWFVLVSGSKHYDLISNKIYQQMLEFIDRINH